MASILRINEILKLKGITQDELADKMEVNRVSLNKTINGNPTLETLKKISFHLGIETKELFYSISKINYNMTKNESDNFFNFDDKHISLLGHLPHFASRDFGTINLTVKRKDFSIVPYSDLVAEFVHSKNSVEEQVFKNDYKDEKCIQLFSTYTSLTMDEYKSFCDALNTYRHFYKECDKEITKHLGVEGFKKIENTDYYILGEVNTKEWNQLMKLTKKFSLESKKSTIDKFQPYGIDIMLYRKDSEDIHQFKTWIRPIKSLFYDDKIVLGWEAPSDNIERNKILKKEIFSAIETCNYLFDIMLPRAKKLF